MAHARPLLCRSGLRLVNIFSRNIFYLEKLSPVTGEALLPKQWFSTCQFCNQHTARAGLAETSDLNFLIGVSLTHSRSAGEPRKKIKFREFGGVWNCVIQIKLNHCRTASCAVRALPGGNPARTQNLTLTAVTYIGWTPTLLPLTCAY